MKKIIYIPLILTAIAMLYAWTHGYTESVDEHLIGPICVLYIGTFNLLLTVRANYLRRQYSQF